MVKIHAIEILNKKNIRAVLSSFVINVFANIYVDRRYKSFTDNMS